MFSCVNECAGAGPSARIAPPPMQKGRGGEPRVTRPHHVLVTPFVPRRRVATTRTALRRSDAHFSPCGKDTSFPSAEMTFRPGKCDGAPPTPSARRAEALGGHDSREPSISSAFEHVRGRGRGKPADHRKFLGSKRTARFTTDRAGRLRPFRGRRGDVAAG